MLHAGFFCSALQPCKNAGQDSASDVDCHCGNALHGTAFKPVDPEGIGAGAGGVEGVGGGAGAGMGAGNGAG